MQTLRSIHSVSIHSVRWLLLAIVMMFIPAASFGQVVGISITVAPPALPVYVQPVCPGENYIWTPGYWAYSDDDEDYYWVPGTWVLVPTLASCGHPVIGGGTIECTFGTLVIGDRTSVSMAGSFTDSGMREWVTRADTGGEEISSTTVRSIT
jgi:hypothetical protein